MLLFLGLVVLVYSEADLRTKNAQLRETNRVLTKALEEISVGWSDGVGVPQWSDEYKCYVTKTSCGFDHTCPDKQGCTFKSFEFSACSVFLGQWQNVCCCQTGQFGSGINFVPEQERWDVEQQKGSREFWEYREKILAGTTKGCDGPYTECGWGCDWNQNCNLADTCSRTDHEHNPHSYLGGMNYNDQHRHQYKYVCAYLQDADWWKKSMGYKGCYSKSSNTQSVWWAETQTNEKMTPQQCKRKCKDFPYFALGGKEANTGGKAKCMCGREDPSEGGTENEDQLCHFGMGNVDNTPSMYAVYNHQEAWKYGHDSGFRYDGQYREYLVDYWAPCKEDLSKQIKCVDYVTDPKRPRSVKEYTGPLPTD